MANHYDKNDIVQQVMVMRAGTLKFAAYRVRDIETGELSPLQFHMTHDNTVIAVMSEQAAKLFNRLTTQCLEEAALSAASEAALAQERVELERAKQSGPTTLAERIKQAGPMTLAELGRDVFGDIIGSGA